MNLAQQRLSQRLNVMPQYNIFTIKSVINLKWFHQQTPYIFNAGKHIPVFRMRITIDPISSIMLKANAYNLGSSTLKTVFMCVIFDYFERIFLHSKS